MTASPNDPLLVRALKGEQVERVPVWFMRQAGRSLPEYRELRKQGSLLEICHRPELAAEATMQPVRRHGVDAAVLFSDIVTPLEAIGVDVEIEPGVGPVFSRPVRSEPDLAQLRDFAPSSDMPELAETIRILVDQLGEVPVIGFAGAPFTLASYLVEGGPSRQQARTKALMLEDPELFDKLLNRLADISVSSLRAQVEAGARAVQVFDSWIGTLSRTHFERHALPVLRRLFADLEDLGVPRVIFGLSTSHLLDLLGETGADCVSVDWRVSLREARERVPARCALQGNLDPAALLTGPEAMERAVLEVLEQAPDRGYVFNLGHGVLPETPPEAPGRVVRTVRERAESLGSTGRRSVKLR